MAPAQSEPSQADPELDSRVAELEIKLSFCEEQLRQQDEVLVEYGARFAELTRTIEALEQRLEAQADGAQEIGPHSERPPHY